MVRDPSMAHAKTVFIVGAGASHEADLPVGRDLPDAIAKMFRYSLGDFGDVVSGDRDFLGQISLIATMSDGWLEHLGPVVDLNEVHEFSVERAITDDVRTLPKPQERQPCC